jgi:hypothetical protein
VSRSEWGILRNVSVMPAKAPESGHPDLATRTGALDSRLRRNDTTLQDLTLNDAPHYPELGDGPKDAAVDAQGGAGCR